MLFVFRIKNVSSSEIITKYNFYNKKREAWKIYDIDHVQFYLFDNA